MNNFFENIYGILFSPRETFEKLFQNPPLLQGFIIVIAVSMLNPLINYEYYSGFTYLFLFGFKIFGAAIAGVISWLFFASFLEMLASIFKQGGKIKAMLTLSAFALIPWILISPLELLKSAGFFASFFGVMLELMIWLWATVLVFMAVQKTYNLSFGRALILFVIPSFGGFLSFHWTIGFFTTLYGIFHI
jgi:hypothetical protein